MKILNDNEARLVAGANLCACYNKFGITYVGNEAANNSLKICGSACCKHSGMFQAYGLLDGVGLNLSTMKPTSEKKYCENNKQKINFFVINTST